ncbi:MAG: preprotein translocase subunit SecG [Clostridia bacterium]|nr:preprotein translocase subunit SecG [Clostridia bacterium]
MLNYINLLADVYKSPTHETVHNVLLIAMIVLMAIAAVAAVILILLQPSNSSGIDALGGSSETFFGKNKGRSIEAKMKKWTWICLALLVVFSLAFYIVQILPVFYI